ncbi:MAG: hypothetical protein DDT32_02057 [Syntrophomonadaceae bacterium]|nr:hypothetical protein [Bacillota bacterium]MBT9148285.1 hypothetical protein [Bacillota bacterium]
MSFARNSTPIRQERLTDIALNIRQDSPASGFGGAFEFEDV